MDVCVAVCCCSVQAVGVAGLHVCMAEQKFELVSDMKKRS